MPDRLATLSLLRDIAERIKLLPGGRPTVTLDAGGPASDAAADVLAEVPGAVASTGLYGGSYALDRVSVTVEGVEFTAVRPRRPITEAERAKLEVRSKL